MSFNKMPERAEFVFIRERPYVCKYTVTYVGGSVFVHRQRDGESITLTHIKNKDFKVIRPMWRDAWSVACKKADEEAKACRTKTTSVPTVKPSPDGGTT